MCGRFTITTNKEQLVKSFKAVPDKDFPARYNAAPLQFLPVITEAEPERIQLYRWGLEPSWFKKLSKREAIINVRAETLRDKPTFKKDLEARRCLVLADGFYEWQETGKVKQPYWIGLEGRKLFAFAGIWEENLDKGEMVKSFAIVTTEANAQMVEIHNRMPVILGLSSRRHWLDQKAKPEELLGLLRPFSGEILTVRLVSSLVNNASYDNPSLIDEV